MRRRLRVPSTGGRTSKEGTLGLEEAETGRGLAIMAGSPTIAAFPRPGSRRRIDTTRRLDEPNFDSGLPGAVCRGGFLVSGIGGLRPYGYGKGTLAA